MSNNVIYPRFISNNPCGEDLFESKSQEQTALSIANYIQSNNADFKLIGLDGEWGSGKSNAISIVEKELGSNYHVFIYDTWAHQEDLQRRSFLEELTDNLQQKKIINQSEWKTKLNDLLAKKKATITSTIPTLNYAIICSLLVAFVTPITKTISDSLPTTTSAYYKAILTASPLIVALIIWVISALFDKKKWNLTHLFRIYEKADLKKTVNETISENEPSLREFRNWIQQLNEDCKKNIVIVFDNMDRLPEEKIKTLWALIHTFFSSENYSNIWIIVPFDRNHIRETFEKSQLEEDFEEVNHFINKTFSIIYNISPAILTDWKKLFKIKFEKAFSEETEKEEYDIVRKIFDLYNTSITPRKIIAFINDLVSLKLIWKEKIKLRYIALYVLNRQEIKKDPLSQILNKAFLSKSKFLFTNDDLVSDSIAALLYNVPIEKATQVTLRRQIELSIREKKADELKEYSQSNDFISSLEQVDFENLDIDATAFCLSTIESSVGESNKEILQVIWDRIIGYQLQTNITKLELTETYKTLIIQCRESAKKTFLKYLLNSYNKNVVEFSGAKYFSVLSSLETFISENAIKIDLTSLIEPKIVSAEAFIDYVSNAKESYKKYKVSCDKKQLDDLFSKKSPLTREDALIIKYIVKEYEFGLLQKTIETLITSNNITEQNLIPTFDIYKSIHNSNPVVLPVKLSDAKVYELLGVVKKDSEEYCELTAMRIARCDGFSSSGPNEQNILQNTDENFIAQIIKRIDYYNHYGTLLINVLKWTQPVLVNVLKKISLSKDYEIGCVLNIESVLPKFEEIITTIKITDEEMFTRLNGWSRFLKKDEISIDNLIKIIPSIEIFKSALKIENKLTKDIFEIAIRCIKEITSDTWSTDFKNIDSYNFKLLRLLLEANKISTLPDNAFTAYKETLKKIALAKGNDYVLNGSVSDIWHFVYTKVDKVHLQPIIKDIRDSFLRTIEITKDKFVFFEPLLREQGDLSEESANVVRKILTPICNEEECFNKIIEYKDFYAPIIISAGNDGFGFIDLLRTKIENQPENEQLSSISQLINAGLSSKIKIIFGKYFSPQKEKEEFKDITNDLKRIVEKERTLHFKVDNNIVGGEDPHPDVVKNLFVKYSYDNKEIEKTFEEHNWFKLP